MTNALHALTGVKASRLSGMVGAQVRTQEVHTPREILDPARVALGGAIEYDPCAASDPAAWFGTMANVTLPPEVVALERLLPDADKVAAAAIKRALSPFYNAPPAPCPELATFANPVFVALETWLAWCRRRGGRTVLLCPARVQRDWFWEMVPGETIVFLGAWVKFVGHTSVNPEPLCLISWGCEIPPIVRQMRKGTVSGEVRRVRA